LGNACFIELAQPKLNSLQRSPIAQNAFIGDAGLRWCQASGL
jgi:hypothetical protein